MSAAEHEKLAPGYRRAANAARRELADLTAQAANVRKQIETLDAAASRHEAEAMADLVREFEVGQ